MVFKLYGADLSTTTPMVAIVLHELNVPFVYFPVDMLSGGHKQPEFVAKQPFGRVPYIDDDGFVLFESRAICRYLCRKYADRGGNALYPQDDLAAFARVEQGISIEMSSFDEVIRAMFTELVYKPMRGVEGDRELYEQASEKLSQNLDVYDKILGEQKYIGGDTFTLADLFHIPYATRLLPKVGCDYMETKPNVARWYKDITSRPSWLANKDGVKAVSP
ncbi:glutathione S-transferase [Schizophyllum amplum]|uniref:glutathione transferase n=1 Tax=Schizophyllum amplum TaxID=97359 RepID=A0A550CIF3_9AGAR|nr:glutathione S-transferase [Auriculariopsis ampla]